MNNLFKEVGHIRLASWVACQNVIKFNSISEGVPGIPSKELDRDMWIAAGKARESIKK